jgi:hypothetical protein
LIQKGYDGISQKGGEKMYKYIVAVIVFAFSVVGGLVPSTYAQDAGNGTFNEAPATDDTTGTTGTTGTTTNEDRGFNWLWLLPLLAIPLFFMFKRDDDADDRSAYRDRGYAGMKGGRSRRDEQVDRDEEVL